MMDLPPQYVPTTDNHWISKAIMILLMSLHSKAFQQSPTAELILSPSPIHEDAPAPNRHETCICHPAQSFLGTWFVLLAMPLTQFQVRSRTNRGPPGVNTLRCTSKVKDVLEPGSQEDKWCPSN